jgi:tetratricopeptide (TPR) repeat protein
MGAGMANSMLRQKHASRAPAPRSLDGPAHLTLAEGLVRVGRLEEAIGLYDAAARSDPGSAPALLGLARALLAAGRAAEAFPRADAALALVVGDVEAWRVVAETLDALGEQRLAAQAFERALWLQPTAPALHLRLGRLYEALDQPHDAAARYLEALRLKGGAAVEIEAHTGLSGLFGRAGQFAQARAHAEEALALAPEARGAHQNLAAICDHEGRLAEAEAHRERAYRAAPLIVTRAAAPRRRVLTLASAERANSPDRYLIPASRYDRLIWFLAYAEGAPGQDYDVAFNALADADAAAPQAQRLADFARASDKPLLNPPDRIAATTRDGAAALLAGVADLLIPETRRVCEAAGLLGLDATRLWLLRPLGAHGGERVEQLRLDEVAAQLDGRPHYLTAFHDFRSGDGLYRKYRMFFVDRAPYPYHLAASRDWLVHYQTSLTPTTPALIDEELRFLENPEAALGTPAFRAISQIGRRLDLDCAGVDFAVLADGRALLFEANATMFVHPEPADGPLRHKNPFIQAILEAFWTRLESA